jgi:hypothetical protein
MEMVLERKFHNKSKATKFTVGSITKLCQNSFSCLTKELVKAHKLRNFSSFPSFQSKSCSQILGFQGNEECTVKSGTYHRFGGTSCLSNLY